MLRFTNVRIAPDAAPTSVEFLDGLIAAIGTAPLGDADEIDAHGLLMLPGLVEPHLHLDKALLNAERPHSIGTLDEAITLMTDLKRTISATDLLERGGAIVESLVANGTTAVRVHTDVDPGVGLLAVEAMLELKRAYAGLVDIQVVAFPQEGIISRPGTLGLLREALEIGADVVGGCSYSEPSIELCEQHVDTVLELAAEFAVPADFHADFADDDSDERFAMARYIAGQTVRRGLGGRVTVSHLTSLAAMHPVDQISVIEALSAARIGVVALPATDLHLGGRTDTHRVRRGITPVKSLRAGGVVTAVSSNNIRNAFTPFGNADQFETGLLLAQTAHFSSRNQLDEIISMITTDAAHIIGLPGLGIRVGAVADVVLVDAPTARDALLDRAPRRYVVKAGHVVAETRVTTVRHYTPRTIVRSRVPFTSPMEAS